MNVTTIYRIQNNLPYRENEKSDLRFFSRIYSLKRTSGHPQASHRTIKTYIWPRWIPPGSRNSSGTLPAFLRY